MLASRAVAHVRLGELDEAADWAVKATGRSQRARPHFGDRRRNAFALTHRRDEASKFVHGIAIGLPTYNVKTSSRVSLRQRHGKLFRRSARQINFDSTP